MPLKEYEQIKLRDDIEGTLGNKDAINESRNRTIGKDEVAQWIVDNVLANDDWPVDMTWLAEQTGYSRQHCANVVNDYFIGVDENSNSPRQTEYDSKPMSQSPSVDTMSTDGQQSATEGVTEKTIYVTSGEIPKEVTIKIPSDADESSYVRGFLAGLEA